MLVSQRGYKLNRFVPQLLLFTSTSYVVNCINVQGASGCDPRGGCKPELGRNHQQGKLIIEGFPGKVIVVGTLSQGNAELALQHGILHYLSA